MYSYSFNIYHIGIVWNRAYERVYASSILPVWNYKSASTISPLRERIVINSRLNTIITGPLNPFIVEVWSVGTYLSISYLQCLDQYFLVDALCHSNCRLPWVPTLVVDGKSLSYIYIYIHFCLCIVSYNQPVMPCHHYPSVISHSSPLPDSKHTHTHTHTLLVHLNIIAEKDKSLLLQSYHYFWRILLTWFKNWCHIICVGVGGSSSCGWRDWCMTGQLKTSLSHFTNLPIENLVNLIHLCKID